MTFLLDVNALVALGFAQHEFHDRVARWLHAERDAVLATCSITELGFVRILSQAPAYALTVAQAKILLLRIKKASFISFEFVTDNHDVSHLPGWVKTAKQTTDGHLARLASANGGVLATLYPRIEGSYLVPGK